MQNVHGVSVAEVPVVSAPPIPLPNISAAGLVGTAPNIVLETPNISGGALTSIRITNQGSGYTSAPTVTLTGGGSGANFTAADVDAIVVGGKVTEIVINNGGSGYTSAPSISITAPTDGITATADAITPGKFTKVVNGQNVAGYDEPFLVLNAADAKELGDRGTLPEALDAIFSQISSARVIVVPIQEYETGAAITSVAIGAWALQTGTRVTTGVATDSNDPANITLFEFPTSPTGVTTTQLQGIKVGQVITLGTSSDTDANGKFEVTQTYDNATGILRVKQVPGQSGLNNLTSAARQFELDAQDGPAKTRTAAIGDTTERTGVYALLSSRSRHGFSPRVITASGLDTGTRIGGNANSLGKAMETVADLLRGVAYIDGPSTTHADALTSAGDYGSDRVYFIDPKVKCFRDGQVVNCAASAFAAGLTLKTDAAYGPWVIPSNQLFNNVLGTERDIDFEMGSANSRAQLLNDAQIATIVNIGGGYRLWGDFTRAKGDRVTWKFLNVRRMADLLYDALADNHLWAVDKNITIEYVETVADGVNAFLDDLTAQEAILGGECFADPTLNTERNLSLGIVTFTIDWTPLYPARQVHFNIELTTSRLATLLN